MSFTAVITGASKGIGLDLAQRLLAITGFTYLANADDLKHRNQETAHQAVIIDHQHGLVFQSLRIHRHIPAFNCLSE